MAQQRQLNIEMARMQREREEAKPSAEPNCHARGMNVSDREVFEAEQRARSEERLGNLKPSRQDALARQRTLRTEDRAFANRNARRIRELEANTLRKPRS